jgi:hypothetical protein
MSALFSATRPLPRPVIWLGALSGLLAAAALVLWAHYGTAVFFEMVRAGWAACF